MNAEQHLSEAIEHVKAAQRECPSDLRDDEALVRAATEIGAARVYTVAAKDATDDE